MPKVILGNRYYAGCENIDVTERLAIERACKLFNCNFANVQPHSGASANFAAQFAVCNPRRCNNGNEFKLWRAFNTSEQNQHFQEEITSQFNMK